jgi:hypothetical protein
VTRRYRDPVTDRPGVGIQIAFDCTDCVRVALWWAEALGWEFEKLDLTLFEALKAQGLCSDDDIMTLADGRVTWRDGAAIHDPSDRTRRFYFQNVPEAKTAKNRLHVDVQVGLDRRDSEVQRLVGLGASIVGSGTQGPHSWVVLHDIEGNEFCVA